MGLDFWNNGNKGVKTGYEGINIPDETLARFKSYADANNIPWDVNRLKGAGQKFVTGGDFGSRKVFGSPTSPSHIYDAQLNDIQPIYDAYNAWAKAQVDSAKVNDEYVRQMKDRPGRDATILVPMSGPESKTVLGSNPVSLGKTVLG